MSRVYSLEEARQKIERYCAYQDRCHYEVSEKLRSYGLLPGTRDQLILDLMRLDFLNEERFSRSFASGKFKIKRWGKIKIKQKLKEKRLTEKCIQLGLQEIDEDEYLNTLKNLIDQKWHQYSKYKDFDRKGKVAQHLYSRGFEKELIWDSIEEFMDENQ